MAESARLVGFGQEVLPLENCQASKFDALFIPGGLGVDHEFSDFEIQRANMTVFEDVEAVIRDFYNSEKYIGLASNSPILVAKIFGQEMEQAAAEPGGKKKKAAKKSKKTPQAVESPGGEKAGEVEPPVSALLTFGDKEAQKHIDVAR